MTRRELLIAMAGAALTTTAAKPIMDTIAQAAPNAAQKHEVLDKSLIKAVRNHNVRLVRDLLRRGADANARDLDVKPDRHGTVQPPFTKEKPMALLIIFDDARIPTGKRENGAPQYKLRPDPAEIVKLLLDKGANPNVIDYDETFPLFEAVTNKFATSVRLLLEHHANPNQTWVHGITPLHRAVSNEDIPTVRALLAAGANPEARCAFDDPAHPLSEKVANLLKSSGDARQNKRVP